MRKEITAKAFVFGKNIDTDQIYPGRFVELVNPADIAKHCLEGADPTFVQRVSPGDIVVAGTNFGCGSSREHAAITLLHAGVSVVLAESFARIFFRNAINIGLLVIECDTDKIDQDDEIEVDLPKGIVKNLTKGIDIPITPLPEVMIKILNEGGLLKHIEKHGSFQLI